MFKRIKLVTAVLLILSLLAGCGSGSALQKKDEKVFTIASSMNLTTMRPWTSDTDGDYYIFFQVYSRLVESDFVGNYYPELAESWECAEDGRTWTFHLSPDYCWQRGNDLFGDELVQVTADDVLYTLRFHMDPVNTCTRYEDLLSTIESMRAVDDKTVEIVTKDVDILLLYKLATVVILPERAEEKGWDLAEHPVGSGPFKWDSSITDTQVVLVKNDDYFIEPNIDKVVYKFIEDPSAAAIALANGEVDYVDYFPYTELEGVKQKKEVTLFGGTSDSRWAAMNVTSELFSDLRVRKAVASFTDMEAIVAAAYPDDGSGVVQAVRAYGQIPPENLGGDQERAKAHTPAYDVEKGIALMEEAGWKKNGAGIWEKDGKTFTFNIQVGTNDPVRINCAVLLSAMLAKQGFDCQPVTVEWGTHLEDISEGRCPMYIIGGFSGIDGPMQVMHTDTESFNPNPGFSDPEVDALLEEAWRTTDDEKREELVTRAQELWLDQVVFLPMYFSYNFQAYDQDRVKGLFEGGVDSVVFCLTSRLHNVDIAQQ